MQRPADLKQELFAYIVERCAELSESELRSLLESYSYDLSKARSRSDIEEALLNEPASFLYHDFHILTKPDSLAGTFIELGDGLADGSITYFIDRTAAEAIALGQHSAILKRNLDGAPFLIPVERIKNAFKNHCTIDYSETSSNGISAL